MNSKTIKRAVLVLIGLFTAVLIIEGLLRLGGWGFFYLQENRNRQSALARHIAERTDIVILCIGESTTGLGGGNSWPSQLERILNSIQDRNTFHVINKGAPAKNTDYILSHLQEYLDEYRPDVVLAMVGINDGTGEGTNSRESFERLESSQAQVNSSQSRLTDGLSYLRIYGLIKWIAQGARVQTTRQPDDVTTASVAEGSAGGNRIPVYGLVNSNVTHLFPRTVRNLNEMVNVTIGRGINFVFVSYALRKTDVLRNVIERDASYISNYEIFRELLTQYNYDDLFTDRFGEDFGHATSFGNRIIADNVARQLLNLLDSQES